MSTHFLVWLIMHSFNALEDLIIAVLFSKSTIVQTKNGRELSFYLEDRKVGIFENYISRHKISTHCSFNKATLEGRIKQSLILERFIKEWTANGEVIALDPSKIRTRMYLLWICLFARKTEKNVIVDTRLSDIVLNTFAHFFYQRFNVHLTCKGESLYVKSYHQIVLFSQNMIPVLETLELNYLLTSKENQAFKKKIAEAEEHEINDYSK